MHAAETWFNPQFRVTFEAVMGGNASSAVAPGRVSRRAHIICKIMHASRSRSKNTLKSKKLAPEFKNGGFVYPFSQLNTC